MPENLDPSSLTSDPIPSTAPETGEEVTPESIEHGAVTPEPAEKYVPLSEHLTERHARQQAQAQLNSLQQHQILLQQEIMAIKAQATPPGAKKDPGIEELLKPYLESMEQELRQVKFEANQAKSEANQARVAMDVQQKVAFMQSELPNFEALRLLIAKEVQQMDPAEQEIILSSPRSLVAIGKALDIQDKAAKSSIVKQIARAAGKTETGSTSVSASADSAGATKDWMDMSAEEFNSNPLVRQMFD